MAKKITVTGKPARRIEVTGTPQRRIKAEEFAAALGAELVGEPHAPGLDPVSLSHLGNELLTRLRSSGGRPALADATEFCRVPLAAEDVKSLEDIIERLTESRGAKPSVGQLISVIVRAHLQSLRAAANSSPRTDEKATASDSSILTAAVRQAVEEQLHPLKERVLRLEAEIDAISSPQV